MNLNGKGSWFGGPNDPEDSGHTASGGTTKEPGIAVYNHGTLGGYWRVTAPNGRTTVVKQTDIGPAPWTGRKIDVTYSALGKFGYGEHNFPTDSEFKATYLGRNPKNAQTAEATPAIPGTPATRIPGTPARQELDTGALRHAQTDAEIGKLFKGSAGSSALFQSGVLRSAAPNPAAFIKNIPGSPGSTVPGTPSQPSVPGMPAGGAAGGKLGGFLPANAELQMNRIDEGQDIKTNPGGAIVAPGDGEVVAVKSDPGGFGPDYPVVKFTSGPMAGTTWYIGHTHSDLKAGEHFKAGQPLSRTGKGPGPVGNATTPGWAEIGLSSALGSGNMNAGQATIPFLRGRRK